MNKKQLYTLKHLLSMHQEESLFKFSCKVNVSAKLFMVKYILLSSAYKRLPQVNAEGRSLIKHMKQ
jgi:hypothetical protein